MSTVHGLVLMLLVGCGSSKQDAPKPAASCLPPATADTGAGLGVVGDGKATACWGGICFDLDREGKVISSVPMPTLPPAQVQQDRQAGKHAEARRDPGGQWTLENPEKGTKVTVGTPGMKLEVFEPGVVVAYQGKRLHLADAVAIKETADYTLPSNIAAIVPWFDRLLIVLEKPAGTAQLEPSSATLYQGAELPRCR